MRPFEFSSSNLPAALPDFAAAIGCLVIWITPGMFTADMYVAMFMFCITEFLAIHSGGAMGAVMFSGASNVERGLGITLLTMLYAFCMWKFSEAADSWVPLVSFVVLVGKRLVFVMGGNADQKDVQKYVTQTWLLGFMCFLFSMLFINPMPLPRLGISANFVPPANMSGSMTERPQNILAWGFVYFSAMALLALGTVPPKVDPNEGYTPFSE